jgi:tRNA 2-thiouridine synthesizing protein A
VSRQRRNAAAAAVPAAQPLIQSPAAPAPSLTVDALGKKCPVPIIMLADRIRDVPVGQVIEVLADDPAAKTDLPAWCALKSQEFVLATELPLPPDAVAPRVPWSFLVRRSY